MTLLTAINVLLHKYSGQNDIIVGVPLAGRLQPELEEQVGLYLNTVAIRTHVQPGDTFAELAQQVGTSCIEAYTHQMYPFEHVVKELNLPQNGIRHPLFTVLVDMMNLGFAQEYNLQDLKVIPYLENIYKKSKFDLTFFVVEGESTVCINIEYKTDIFHPGTIKRLSERLNRLLSKVVNKNLTIEELVEEELPVVPTLIPFKRHT